MRTNYNLTIVLTACLVIVVLTSLFIYFYQYSDDVVVMDRDVPEAQPTFMMLTVGKHNDHGWNESHVKGFMAAVNQLNLVAEIHDNISAQECRLYVDDFVLRGGSVVILPSDEYVDCINSAAAQYPKVKFITTIDERVKIRNNVYSFYSRMYIVRYLSGILAGMTGNTSDFGYVYVKRNSETIRGINAFTIGVRSVRPRGKVYTFQVKTKGEQDLPNLLDDFYDKYPSIKTWTYHLSDNDMEKFCDRNSLKCISFHVNKQASFVNSSIGSAVWDWSLFYRQLARSILTNSFKSGVEWLPEGTATSKLKGVSSKVPVEVVNYIDSENSCLATGECAIFRGVIVDNQKNIKVSTGMAMSEEDLLYHFDWFVEGVEEVVTQ